jgi:hypothetical protein
MNVLQMVRQMPNYLQKHPAVRAAMTLAARSGKVGAAREERSAT